MVTEIVDAHHHLWKLDAVHYPWLMARGVKRFFGDPAPIQRDYSVDDFQADFGDLPVRQSVHIQVGAAPEQSLAESRWLQSVADDGGFPNAIVAFCDLTSPDAESQLSEQARIPNVRGIRQIVGREPEEDRLTGSGRLLDDERWQHGLGLLPGFGLSFDLQLIPPQLIAVAKILERHPDLAVALCHCGSPWDRSADGLDGWRRGLRALARLPNVYCKISGLGMFDHRWNTESIRPIVLDVLDIFGVERCMLGSNFPVDKLYGDYVNLWAAYASITASLTAAERRLLYAENARRFYRLEPAVESDAGEATAG